MSKEIIDYQVNRLRSVRCVDTEFFSFEAKTSLEIAYNEGRKGAEEAMQEIEKLSLKRINKKLPKDPFVEKINAIASKWRGFTGGNDDGRA